MASKRKSTKEMNGRQAKRIASGTATPVSMANTESSSDEYKEDGQDSGDSEAEDIQSRIWNGEHLPTSILTWYEQGIFPSLRLSPTRARPKRALRVATRPVTTSCETFRTWTSKQTKRIALSG